MYEIAAFLRATSPKVAKVSKPRAKALRLGAKVLLFIDGNEYTIVERDTRYKAAWFIADANGTRVEYSF
jgi:hypothetical protein